MPVRCWGRFEPYRRFTGGAVLRLRRGARNFQDGVDALGTELVAPGEKRNALASAPVSEQRDIARFLLLLRLDRRADVRAIASPVPADAGNDFGGDHLRRLLSDAKRAGHAFDNAGAEVFDEFAQGIIFLSNLVIS